ncbi:MAG: vWA domain-containing protein [Actinomycetota bacterium]
MLDRVLEFTGALRNAGVPVAVSDDIDALRALEHVELGHKTTVRAALAATLVKTQTHRGAFDTLFELYFGAGRGADAVAEQDEAYPPADPERLLDELFGALLRGDPAGLREISRRAVAGFGRVQGSRSRDWYSQYEVMRTLAIDELIERLERQVLEEDDMPALERRLLRDEFERRLRQFKEMTLAETRRRVAEFRGPEAVASYAVGPLPEDTSFFSATSDLDEMRKAVRPLARKLATRIGMKRRRARRGNLDIRRTMRHSLSTGGVPFEAEFKHRVPHRPELMILCDVSSSVARFSRFALMLTHALSAQFSRVRSFAFVDTIDEVTRFFEHEDFVEAVDTMNREARVVSHDGHSDYGEVFERFLTEHGPAVGPKTTMLVLGDARTNYRARRIEALRELSTRARHTFWLNPEPLGDWDTGDSAASEYAGFVDRMVEVRNLRQLEEFIAREL